MSVVAEHVGQTTSSLDIWIELHGEGGILLIAMGVLNCTCVNADWDFLGLTRATRPESKLSWSWNVGSHWTFRGR